MSGYYRADSFTYTIKAEESQCPSNSCQQSDLSSGETIADVSPECLLFAARRLTFYLNTFISLWDGIRQTSSCTEKLPSANLYRFGTEMLSILIKL